MGPSGSEPLTRGIPPRPLEPCNLTAATEFLPWAEACKIIDVSGQHEAALEVCGLTEAESCRKNDGALETVYVVIAGFGMLRCHDVDIDCTAGDVLFVPKGCPHRFEQLDGEIKVWRISSANSKSA